MGEKTVTARIADYLRAQAAFLDEVDKIAQAPVKPSEPSHTAVDAEFDEWWPHYPRRDDKGHGRIAFRGARKKASLAELIAGADRYSEEVADRDKSMIALPATWLRGERWLQEDVRTRLSTTDAEMERWRVLVRAYVQRGQRNWPSTAGPAPKKPGCQVPREIIAEFFPSTDKLF